MGTEEPHKSKQLSFDISLKIWGTAWHSFFSLRAKDGVRVESVRAAFRPKHTKNMAEENKVVVKVHWDSELEVTQTGPLLPLCMDVVGQFCSRQIPFNITIESPGITESLTFSTQLRADLVQPQFAPYLIQAVQTSYRALKTEYERKYPNRSRDASPVRKYVSDSITMPMREGFMLLLDDPHWIGTFASYMEQWGRSDFLRFAKKQMTTLLRQRYGDDSESEVVALIGKQFTSETWAQIKTINPRRRGPCENCGDEKTLCFRFLPNASAPTEGVEFYCDVCSKYLRAMYGFLNSAHNLVRSKRAGTVDPDHMWDIMEQDLQAMIDWAPKLN